MLTNIFLHHNWEWGHFLYSLAIHLNASIEIVITNHADVTLIEVACGYFRTEFDPIASYRIVLQMSLYEIFVLDPLWLNAWMLCCMCSQKEAFTLFSTCVQPLRCLICPATVETIVLYFCRFWMWVIFLFAMELSQIPGVYLHVYCPSEVGNSAKDTA